MALLIDMAKVAEAALNPADTEVSIMPSERDCDECFVPMTLTVLVSGSAVLRIHKCPDCKHERRYGGRAY